LLVGPNGSLATLIGTNSGPLLREQINGSWGMFQALDSELVGETWVTGLLMQGSARLCAYWNGIGTLSAGFSIQCRGNVDQLTQPDIPSAAVSSLNLQHSSASTANEDNAAIIKHEVQESTVATRNGDEQSNDARIIPLSDAQRTRLPQYVSSNGSIIVSVLFSMLTLFVVIAIKAAQRAWRK
jgi:hypothetical protein